tara:strand:+ start:17401 stop:18144 length:744 start_codon:yes stop_codon:yes gene_type:complete
MPYKRVISLVPSLTELLIDFGLKDRLVGRTKFCIHPKEIVSDLQPIGGTKNPNIQKILSLKPDLIITNKEENRKEDVIELSKHCEVVLTEIDTIEEALQWISKLGNKLEVDEEALQLITEIQKLIPSSIEFQNIRTAYFIWKDPWMTIGSDTYIHNVMKYFGLKNVYGEQSRYPETDFEELHTLNPELILLSSEPYPFKQKHILELKTICPDSTILLVNGEWFSWYGSRMVVALKELLNWRKQYHLK